jgi:hypothetical protein
MDCTNKLKLFVIDGLDILGERRENGQVEMPGM